jgi:hypothetical protein
VLNSLRPTQPFPSSWSTDLRIREEKFPHTCFILPTPKPLAGEQEEPFAAISKETLSQKEGLFLVAATLSFVIRSQKQTAMVWMSFVPSKVQVRSLVPRVEML